jgi:hypothetical protein
VSATLQEETLVDLFFRGGCSLSARLEESLMTHRSEFHDSMRGAQVRNTLTRLAACAGLAVVTALPAWADVAVAQPALQLRVGNVQPQTKQNFLAGDAPLTDRVYILTLRSPLNDGITQRLAAMGISMLTPVPDHAALISLTAVKGDARVQLRAIPEVAQLLAFESTWKIDPALAAGTPKFAFETPARIAAQAAGDCIAHVHFVPGVLEREARAAITALQAKGAKISVLSSQSSPGFTTEEVSLVIRIPAAQVGLLASEPLVLFAEHAPEFSVRSNSLTRGVVQGGLETTTPFYTNGVTGLGQIIGVIDDPYNTSHCSVFDVQPIGPTHRKLVAYNGFAGSVTHGIHVSTTLAGDDPTNANLRGIAYQARMAYNNLPAFGEANVYSRFELHRTQGAFVHNNSWGNASTTDYDSTARAIDNFMWTNEDQLLVFSTANLTLIRNPENAKNVVAVSASRNYPQENEYCAGGRGPTLDGRRKPEVLAPGCSIISGGAAPCATATLSGTSMATPAVSGLATLFRQYFTDGYYPAGTPVAGNALVPTGALLRAMISNCAQDMTGITGYPSTQEGWGRVLGDATAYFAGDARKLIVKDVRRTDELSLGTNESFSMPVDVGPGQELRITLAYTDAPGAIFATAPVINNLDLVVTSPSNVTYLGNVFASRQSVPAGTADAINNLEQVLLHTPEAGRYVIEVRGTQVQVGPQGFAIVVTGDVQSGMTCDTIDFNNDGLFPSDDDIYDFLSVYAGGPCSAGNTCNDIDFNNDGLFPSDEDIIAFFGVLAGGACE